ncbi:MAG: hypothetical protein OCD00_10945 [Colwellia sp.]
MEKVQNLIATTLKTSELPFELAPEIKHYFENELNRVGIQNSGRECLVIFPDRFVEHLSILSFVMFQRVDKQCWEIRGISIYQVIDQGQSTTLIGMIDGKSREFDRIDKGFVRDNLINQWQVGIVLDIKYQQITGEQGFNSQHLKLLRSTGHEVIADFEEQKPELCGT